MYKDIVIYIMIILICITIRIIRDTSSCSVGCNTPNQASQHSISGLKLTADQREIPAGAAEEA